MSISLTLTAVHFDPPIEHLLLRSNPSAEKAVIGAWVAIHVGDICVGHVVRHQSGDWDMHDQYGNAIAPGAPHRSYKAAEHEVIKTFFQRLTHAN